MCDIAAGRAQLLKDLEIGMDKAVSCARHEAKSWRPWRSGGGSWSWSTLGSYMKRKRRYT